MAVKGHYGSGKMSGLHNHGGTSHSMGKGSNSTGVKVTASAGKNSGTARGGDKKGCAPMKGC
jgi:hypothetical protein